MDSVMRYYSGDEKGFAELLELYHMDGARKVNLLRELVDTDLKCYQIEVHGLKSASAGIGAMEVSALAREQENAAAKGDQAFISEKFSLLMGTYETLLANIGTFLREREEREKLPSLLPGELRERTAKALDDLEHFRSPECAEGVEELLLHELPGEVEERLMRIREQLKLYEDDNAEELLRALSDILEKEEEENGGIR